MTPGSIVECIRIDPIEHELIRPALKTRYMVRDFIPRGTTIIIGDMESIFVEACIRLEEIVNPIVFVNNVAIIEPAYAIKNWREVLPPIENIEEHVKENTLEPQLL